MCDVFKEFADGDGRGEFLANLADKALLKRLASLALAAGKLPQPAEMGAGAAPGDEQLAVAEDERGADFNDE